MRKPEPTHIGSLAGKEPNAEATSGRNLVVQSNVAKVLHDGHAACHPLFDLCPMMSVVGPTLPTLAVQQDGSYLGCTGNRLTYGPARRRIGSDNVSSR